MIPTPARRSLLGSVVAVTMVVTAGCVPGEALPSTCSDPAVALQLTLADNRLDPANLGVCHGQHVTVQLTPQESGAIHFHGYDDQVPETDLQAGQSVTLEFDATHAGQFPIELHPADGSDEIEVGTLTVNEP